MEPAPSEGKSAATVLSLATGLRAGKVTGLQWSQVDLTRRLAWIHPDQAKARKAIAVPLNAEALALIKQVGKHRTHVFSYCGKPIIQLNTKAWYAALKRAGIADFRWHDLRHTWASWHVQNGTPMFRCRSWAAGRRRRWCGRAHGCCAKLWHKSVTPRKLKGPA